MHYFFSCAGDMTQYTSCCNVTRACKLPVSIRKKQKSRSSCGFFGAGDVTRTHDLLITNQLHYRLCYTSNIHNKGYYILKSSVCQYFFEKSLKFSEKNVAMLDFDTKMW